MKAQLETITPTRAEEYLRLNSNNRKVRPKHVQFLKDEIVDGRWVMNGATIVLGQDRLLDGQHRLLAVVAAKKAIKSMVIKDVENENFSTIDTGASRRASDVLGIKGEKGALKLSPAIMWILRYRDGNVLAHKRVSSSRIEQFLDSNGALRGSYEICKDIRIMSVPVAMAAHFLFKQKDAALADAFIDGMKNGFTRSDGDAFFDFRERMIESRTKDAKLHPLLQFAFMIKAWNLKRKHEKMDGPLTFRPWAKGKEAEAFPDIR